LNIYQFWHTKFLTKKNFENEEVTEIEIEGRAFRERKQFFTHLRVRIYLSSPKASYLIKNITVYYNDMNRSRESIECSSFIRTIHCAQFYCPNRNSCSVDVFFLVVQPRRVDCLIPRRKIALSVFPYEHSDTLSHQDPKQGYTTFRLLARSSTNSERRSYLSSFHIVGQYAAVDFRR